MEQRCSAAAMQSQWIGSHDFQNSTRSFRPVCWNLCTEAQVQQGCEGGSEWCSNSSRVAKTSGCSSDDVLLPHGPAAPRQSRALETVHQELGTVSDDLTLRLQR